MTADVDHGFWMAEVDRAVKEVRSCLSVLAQQGRLTHPLMSVSTLMDRIEFCVSTEDGESAFVLDEEENRVSFRCPVLQKIHGEIFQLSSEIGLLEEEPIRASQIAINLFVVHELLHIRQNFPHFATVQSIKAGLEGIGLPLLDVAADTVAAWVCAHVEAQRNDDNFTEEEVLKNFSNLLILAYVVGAFVYDGRSTSGKRQRLLGLLISAMLVQAQNEGVLNVEKIYEGWTPISPIMVIDLEKAARFNAIVIDKIPGMLFSDAKIASPEVAKKFWNSVGERPVFEALTLAAVLLRQVDAIY
ncbi:hypothetical protein FIL70_10410 [Sphingobium fuliginis ATCC 27551]|uniref:Uncharacterized protein n=2 Tax=Sphingobium fuliginis (strain ATCC 27551) TaxID=336203 RepID=A0A5B8CFE9_SPHSA|nr:hypothetical protein FIL70_10410 [Sphingobium fuliginis ATCC 27551]